ncbi:hypothetical protein ACHM2J_12375 [Clostridium perfringens]|uniref:hypothetical protein n=1 Tax=Clostridium perfringens TaxID=1502 RepID=UPI0018A95CA5|nr:hypothetical protein [Clostridium perfringens]ELC8373508.1 hypothetical protein [Clostridium perfringens]ELC8402408.1 hypothetical protein [Clostridium perfringens]MDB2069885.1 hypothetical protein [Clostridium perfringens]MDK0855776.1 hypothetical protein [Clostridium perfringens]MDM0926942.1 hypothetical protein [Clostridium perfringens]
MIIIVLIIIGIVLVSQRNEAEGFFKALKSLFMLLIVLGCFMLIGTGVGAVVGIPILWAIARIAMKRM